MRWQPATTVATISIRETNDAPSCGAEDALTSTKNFNFEKGYDESFQDRDIDGIEDESKLSLAIS